MRRIFKILFHSKINPLLTECKKVCFVCVDWFHRNYSIIVRDIRTKINNVFKFDENRNDLLKMMHEIRRLYRETVNKYEIVNYLKQIRSLLLKREFNTCTSLTASSNNNADVLKFKKDFVNELSFLKCVLRKRIANWLRIRFKINKMFNDISYFDIFDIDNKAVFSCITKTLRFKYLLWNNCHVFNNNITRNESCFNNLRLFVA